MIILVSVLNRHYPGNSPGFCWSGYLAFLFSVCWQMFILVRAYLGIYSDYFFFIVFTLAGVPPCTDSSPYYSWLALLVLELFLTCIYFVFMYRFVLSPVSIQPHVLLLLWPIVFSLTGTYLGRCHSRCLS